MTGHKIELNISQIVMITMALEDYQDKLTAINNSNTSEESRKWFDDRLKMLAEIREGFASTGVMATVEFTR